MCVCNDEEVAVFSWGWTDLSTYSSSASDSEKEQLTVMSRLSLRLDDSLLDRSLPHSSASFSIGGGGGIWRNSRSLKSRRSQQHSVSCSESLLVHTPHKLSGPLVHNSSVHSVASDASLLSSLLDESSIQDSTLVDTLWGLDHDNDPKESTIIAEQSTVVADTTLTPSGGPNHPIQTLSRVYCKNYEPAAVYNTTSKHIFSSTSLPRPSEHEEHEPSTIYCRDRNRRSRTGFLMSGWSSALAVSRRAAAGVFSLLYQLLLKHWDISARCNVTGLIESSTNCLRPSSFQLKLLSPPGDNCREQHTAMEAVRSSSWFPLTSSVLGMLWKLSVFTASQLLELTWSSASAVWPLTKTVVSASWRIGCSAAGEAFRRLSKRWPSSTSLLWTRSFLPLVLVSLLVFLLGLCWFGPVGLQSVFPAVDTTQWRIVSSVHSSFSSSPESPSAESALESRELQTHQEFHSSFPRDQDTLAAEDQSTRLVHLEQSLATLWQHVEAGVQRAAQKDKEMLQLYADLQQQLTSAPGDGEAMKSWLSVLLDHQLDQIRTQLDAEGKQREQTRQQDLQQQQSQASRLDHLELQLQRLAARTEVGQKMQQSQEAAANVPSSSLPAAVGDHQSHDALLAEVARLEESVEGIRQDVMALSVVQNSCQQLDRIQQMISTQVREEVRALVYGNQLSVGDGPSGDRAGIPESLLQWLSQQFVSVRSLAALERTLLQNMSQQLEQRFSEDTVRHVDLDAAGASVTQEDVHAIVSNALRLFSQDRTGMADYALESAGGSILSTRCSETYQTKAALLSLFGLPLWYFSQSPRAVIQPEVHPGNCWAFRGSSGFLVIRLSMRILPSAFSLEHIPKALTPSGSLLSAPRDFRVYGLDDENQETGKLLGTYTYDKEGEALQTYAVIENDRAFQIMEVRVLSNWGHKEYTCMYRFRVHGTPSDA
ncbi:SUN domain-containing protein 2-like isoform X2 [Betta splendens]|uniref:SUN domain-containing protein 2-like isoform X2 n=1 Tax=Betta splendens TaxID=158456 RepID=A0A9W2XEQ9_BETSP|nr:SUN domain-containing protein 2-like isoform X2 [Betta splendens]